jgi:hypothetical protein
MGIEESNVGTRLSDGVCVAFFVCSAFFSHAPRLHRSFTPASLSLAMVAIQTHRRLASGAWQC